MNYTGCFFKSACFFFKKLKLQVGKFQLIFRNDLHWSGSSYYRYVEDTGLDEVMDNFATETQAWIRKGGDFELPERNTSVLNNGGTD